MRFFRRNNTGKNYDIVCPYCFEKFSTDSVLFRASHSNASPEFKKRIDPVLNNYRSKFKLDDLSELNAVIYPEDMPDGRKRFVDNRVLIEIIDDMNIATDDRLCPYCHNSLPKSSGRAPTNIISIVGAAQVGKSVFISSLINTLQDRVADNFGASILPLNLETNRNYIENFRNPMYRNNILLEPDQKIDKIAPMLFDFVFKEEQKLPLLLVFFDMAGEGMMDTEYLKIYASHIKNSSGIIFLVDPLQIDSINRKISEVNDEDFEQWLSEGLKITEPSDGITSLYENFIAGNSGSETEIPTAVALTKSDLLKGLRGEYLHENSNIFTDYEHKKYFNLSEFYNIDGEVGRFIEAVDKPFADSVRGRFKDVGYFAISSIGSNPKKGKIEEIIQPVRVCEPFLWLLYKLGYINGEED